MIVRQLAWPNRPTPGLKAKPQGATPQPKPTQGGALSVLPQPPPHTPRPKNPFVICLQNNVC
ncbi:hypothetical protein HanIR_Chr12g0607391 [Helianthus annuus]|nr:hypothetical protein HanIR_Chr12g0607391 [Helianthus annuus]